PDYLAAIGNLVELRWQQQRFDDSEALIERYRRISGDDLGCDLALAASYALAGKGLARETLEKAESRPNPGHLFESMRVVAYIGLGDTDKAVRLIQDEYGRGADWLEGIIYDRNYAPVRNDPRVIEILRKLKDN
ncbi:MAG TPA: hypothetical protein VFE91_03895, partial [Nitrososphaerales archaeon]|nr:hypothetical protein [Nitrososphaerales archaeon]